MKKLTLLLAAITGACTLTIGQVTGPVPGCPGAFGPTKIIVGTSKNDTTSVIRNPGGLVTWVKDTIYIVKKLVRVAPNTSLSIRPGTIVMGFPGPLDTSAIIIKQGAKILSSGQPTNPVVLTSCKIQGARNRGDWGGLVICGNAVTNLGVNQTLEGGYGATYGGTDPEDNSGTVQYTRVEFAGFAFAPNQELNGITLAAVGAKTIFQFVEVSNANDDSFEWFGGSVNAKNLIAFKGLDDDFDTDNGYDGLVQFGIGYRDYATADFSGSNGFESDNEAAGDVTSPAKSPKTTAIFTNFTMYGPIKTNSDPYNKFFKTGATLRRNTEQDIYNSIFIGFPGDSTVASTLGGKESSGPYISGDSAALNALAGRIRFKKNTVTAYNNNPYNAATDNSSLINAESWFNTPAFYNNFSGLVYNYVGQTPFALRAVPGFRNNPGSSVLTGSSFPAGGAGPLNSDLPIGNLFAANPPRGFSNVTYRGATSQVEWAEPWAEYNPNLFKYVAGQVPTRQGSKDAFLAGNEVSATGIVISPNPAVVNTELSFLMENETTDAAVTVLDMAGNVVFAQATGIIAGVNNVALNTAGLEPGMYIVRVSANGTTAKSAKLNVVR